MDNDEVFKKLFIFLVICVFVLLFLDQFLLKILQRYFSMKVVLIWVNISPLII